MVDSASLPAVFPTLRFLFGWLVALLPGRIVGEFSRRLRPRRRRPAPPQLLDLLAEALRPLLAAFLVVRLAC
jgi:hypothetical protein